MSHATPLPPRPRRREWALGGLVAGLLLGVFERALGLAEGVVLGPALAMTAVFASAGLVAALAAFGGLIAARWRLSQSAMVGGVVGAIVGAPPLGTGLGAALAGRLDGDVAWPLGLGFAIAIAVGFAAGWLAERFERGRALAAPPLAIWAVAAFLVASSERRFAVAASLTDIGIVLVAAVALAVAGTLAVGASRVRVGPLGRSALIAGVAAVTVAMVPRIGPWLWYEPDLNAPLSETPSLLLVALPKRHAGARPLASVEILASAGARLEVRDADPSRVGSLVDPLLRLSDGSSLLARLHARGFTSAAVLADPSLPPPSGVLDVRGPDPLAARLAIEVRSTAGGAVLAASDWFGLAERDRRAEEVTTAAVHWLLAWRASPRTRPFALVVDYRPGRSAPPADTEVERALERLLAFVDEIGASPSTLVGVVEMIEPRALRVVLRPPEALGRNQTRRTPEPVGPDEVAARLLEAVGEG